ncbi:MAG TPA: hypothetical protein VFC04_00030 [Actinomycetota bacterium]|nr:hypothetical protein [Actinomycetota bacterium]
MVPCAELRVFQPLDAFPPRERAEWERYLVGGGSLRPPRPLYHERVTSSRLGVLFPAVGEGADVRVEGGVSYLCPWRTRLRVLASLLSFREAAPFEGSEAFIPDADVRKVSRELARMRRRDPNAISFIMQSPWHVPVRWFVLFDDEERRLAEEQGRHRLRYRTTVRKAMTRAERAVPALRRADLGAVAEPIVELYEWLSAFDPRSIVELDYGALCDLLSWDELDDDHSARDVQEALRALSSEGLARSADLYQSVISRWAEVRAREGMN